MFLVLTNSWGRRSLWVGSQTWFSVEVSPRGLVSDSCRPYGFVWQRPSTSWGDCRLKREGLSKRLRRNLTWRQTFGRRIGREGIGGKWSRVWTYFLITVRVGRVGGVVTDKVYVKGDYLGTVKLGHTDKKSPGSNYVVRYVSRVVFIYGSPYFLVLPKIRGVPHHTRTSFDTFTSSSTRFSHLRNIQDYSLKLNQDTLCPSVVFQNSFLSRTKSFLTRRSSCFPPVPFRL